MRYLIALLSLFTLSIAPAWAEAHPGLHRCASR